MKKSQRLRFFALIQKQAKGETLNATETADLKTLSALVSTHPSAAEDTDDTTEKKEETEQEKKDREAKEAEEAEANKDKATKPGVGARLVAALAGLNGTTPANASADLQKARQDLAKSNGDLTKANADLVTANAALKKVTEAHSAVCDFLGIAPADVAGKSQADIDGICAAKINAAAVTEQLAGLGIAPGRLPKPNGGSGASATLEEIQAEMGQTTDPEKLGKLAAKANALRDKPTV